MKKKLLQTRLSISKSTIATLNSDAQHQILGGGGSSQCQSMNCSSKASDCLCPPVPGPQSGNMPCCPAPKTWTKMDQDLPQ